MILIEIKKMRKAGIMSIYVFDSSALIAFFNDEEGADNVEKILLQNSNTPS